MVRIWCRAPKTLTLELMLHVDHEYKNVIEYEQGTIIQS